MKKIKLFITIIMICVLFAGCNNTNPLYKQYKYPNERLFGKTTYSEILYKCTDEEKEEVSFVLQTAEEVFSYVGSEADAPKNVGALLRYYEFSDIRVDTVSEKHEITFITTKHDDKTGFIWIAYVRNGIDSKGDTTYGSGSESEKILARWELEKIEDVWVVNEVREAA